MRALFIKAVSAYDATPVFIDHLAAACAGRGGEALVVDGNEAGLAERLKAAAAAGPIDFAYSIGSHGQYRDADGRCVGDVIGAPHVIHYVDYPLSHAEKLEQTSKDAIILVVDESHVKAVRSIFGETRFALVAFCPHGGLAAEDRAETEDDYRRRPIGILFAGSFYEAGAPVWAAHGQPVRKILDTALKIAGDKDWTPALDAVDRSLKLHGFAPNDPRVAALRPAAALVHEHLRARRRLLMLETLSRLAIPVEVYGSGYGGLEARFTHLRFHGAAKIGEVLALMRQARVVLNVNANFGRGSHERSLSAMMAGAVAATDPSTFYKSQFAKEDLFVYRWDRLEPDLRDLAALAQTPERAYAIACAGWRNARANHGWDRRLDTIIAAVERAGKR